MYKEILHTLIAEAKENNDCCKAEVYNDILHDYKVFCDDCLTESVEMDLLRKLYGRYLGELEESRNKLEKEKLESKIKFISTLIPDALTFDSSGLEDKVRHIIETFLLSLPVEERTDFRHLNSIIALCKAHSSMLDNVDITKIYFKMLGK